MNVKKGLLLAIIIMMDSLLPRNSLAQTSVKEQKKNCVVKLSQSDFDGTTSGALRAQCEGQEEISEKLHADKLFPENSAHPSRDDHAPRSLPSPSTRQTPKSTTPHSSSNPINLPHHESLTTANMVTKIDSASEQTLLFDNRNLLIPRLKGLSSDSGQDWAITSEKRWFPEQKGGCQKPVRDEKLCQKSRALKEIVVRFSGNDDFYRDQCHKKCAEKDHVSLMTGFLLTNPQDLQLEVIEDGLQCRFRLKKNPDKSWLVGKTKEVACECLSIHCLE